jgi:DNA polymerase III delta subunit
MVHLIFGNDMGAVRKAALSYLDKVGVNAPERVDENSYEPGRVSEAASAHSLFGERLAYVFEYPSSNDEYFKEVTEAAAAIKDSAHVYLIIEGPLLAAQKKAYGAIDSVEECTSVKGPEFNVFALAEAVAVRDKKAAWVLLEAARQHGLSAEEITGTLWWQLKTLLLAMKTTDATEAGIKDYPYKKAKRALKHHTEDSLLKTSETLLAVYHDGHRGKVSIDEALESWILSL